MSVVIKVTVVAGFAKSFVVVVWINEQVSPVLSQKVMVKRPVGLSLGVHGIGVLIGG